MSPLPIMDAPDDAQLMQANIDEKRSKKELLASKYTKNKRNTELLSCFAFVSLLCISFIRICNLFFFQNIWVFLCSSVLAMFVSDFFSGIVHWGADTWGSLDTPLVGQSFIRSFREHHLSPVAICKHDIIEVNGDNAMIALPFLLITALVTPKQNDVYFLFIHSFLVVTCLLSGLTNQIHKWTHTYKLPYIVKFMMDSGVILSKKDHAVHHRNPFDKYYCITTGWLNPVLANINFWTRLEGVITFVSGAVPREDDMLWTGTTMKLE